MKIFGVCDGDGTTQGEVVNPGGIPVGWKTVIISEPGRVPVSTATYCPRCFATITFPSPPPVMIP